MQFSSLDLFAFCPDLAAVVGVDGVFLKVNARWSEAGWDATQLVGTSLLNQAPSHERRRILEVLAGTEPSRLDHRFYAPKGGFVWLEWSLRRLDDTCWLGIARDVTATRVQLADLRQADEYTKNILNNGGDAILVHDAEGRLTDANDRACRMLGYARAELVGQSMVDLEAGFEQKAAWHHMIPGNSMTLQGGYRAASGRVVPVEVRVEVFESLSRRTWVAFARDITARLRAQEQLEILNRELQMARDRAVAASTAKSSFVANMSHELRTPLNAIIGYTELLAEEAEEAELVEMGQDLARVRSAAAHLLSLINDILDLSKIEAGHLELLVETTSIADLVASVVATVAPLADKNANAFIVEVPEEIGTFDVDPIRVRQALINLLGNAMKFTRDGTVTLRVSSQSSASGRKITFAVHDTGIGIPASQLERLFEAFVQADSRKNRAFGGSGLGLAIARHIARLHHGDILVRSVVDEGSVFTLRLPVSGPATPRNTLVSMPPSLTSHPTVLVIDDDDDVHIVMRRRLEREGIRVISAMSGPAGLDKARSESPDLIVLDVLMPDVDGWTVLTTLKRDAELARIPVVMASMVEQTHRGFSLGAAEYLVKPIDRETLISTVRRFVRSSPDATILVADDDPETRLLVRRALERQGWTVTEASDGREALAACAAARPSLLVLDLIMPGPDGFEVLEQLRSDPALADLPVVVLTALELTAEQRQRLEAGARRVLSKGSASLDALCSEVTKILQITQ